eukprot:scaffold1270_cov176-Alexandrium_tamarense.AAC.11
MPPLGPLIIQRQPYEHVFQTLWALMPHALAHYFGDQPQIVELPELATRHSNLQHVDLLTKM